MSARSRDLPRRSCLSIPGSSEKMMGKGPGIAADMVFLDLEDAVAPKEKESSRAKIATAIRT
ncbi:MAG: CoA ester lyase, partial [Actinobacteria bacterium]|nr:CoA ester lyase [Actinomycetota bacterium]